MVENLQEELEKEALKKATKDARYYKWVAENPNASNKLKKLNEVQYKLCDNFTSLDECHTENVELSTEDWHKFNKQHNIPF